MQRPHRALQRRPPRPEIAAAVPEPVLGKIRRRPVLGGLVNQYEPAARNRWSRTGDEFLEPTPVTASAATEVRPYGPSRFTQYCVLMRAARIERQTANEPKTMHVQGVIEHGWFDTYTTDRGRRPAQQVVASTLPDATS
jgi:hypothetical protein